MESEFFGSFVVYSNVLTAMMFGDYEEALVADAMMPLEAVTSVFVWYEYIVWRAILYLAVMPTPDAGSPHTSPQLMSYTSEQASRLALVRDYLTKLKKVAKSPSLECKILLIRAELSRVEGGHAKAQELYEESIESARKENYFHVLGYANEQAMKFYLSKRLDRAATGHFREARVAYFSWGAFAKSKQLEAKYSFLMYGSVSQQSAPLPPSAVSPVTRGVGMDLTSVVKACQVLSSEIDPAKLISNMVKIVIQNAGAQLGSFIVPDISGRLFIKAQGEAGTEHIQKMNYDLSRVQSPEPFQPIHDRFPTPNQQLSSHPTTPVQVHATRAPTPPVPMSGVNIPLAHSPHTARAGSPLQAQSPSSKTSSPRDDSHHAFVPTHSRQRSASNLNDGKPPNFTPPPVGIIQYVYRTKTHVLLDDACQEGMFTFEPHVQVNRTKSVLCLPVIKQSKVVAILYLENNVMSGAFTYERLEIVQLLSAQIGISFENATLYKNLQTANGMLETKNKELTEMDHIKDQFLANTSHELRTPLNGIIGLAESLIDGATGDLSQATCNNLAMIVNSGKRLANLVNDILDLSALKAGSLTIRPRPTNMRNILDEVLFLSSHLIGAKNLRLMDNTHELPVMNVDEGRIQQVLQNVIGNAIKFTHSGAVSVSSRMGDEWFELVVSDSGCGIPNAELDVIFEDFKQVDGSMSREVGGTGLGLSIARRLLEMHGGRITVTSEMDKGSTFTIKLPANLKLEATITNVSTTEEKKFRQWCEYFRQKCKAFSEGQWGTHSHKQYKEGGKATILSVDDDPTNQTVLRKLLSPHFNFIEAMSGDEALEIINNSSTPPDFVLLDVMMPKMSGLEVCEKVRERFPMCDLPIIMVSAKNRPENIVEGLSRGANDYVSKPVNKNELLARIRAQLMICHSCRMVCKASGSSDDDYMCESCKQSKGKIIRSRRASLDFVTDLVNEPPNTLEILNHLPFIVTICNSEGKAIMRNSESKVLFESLPEASTVQNQTFLPHVLNRATADKLLAEAKVGDAYEKSVEVFNAISITTYHRIWAKSITMSIQTKAGTYVMVVELDITDAHKGFEELTRAKSIDRQKNELLHDLAHNIKSPLSGIVAFVESFEEETRGVQARASPITSQSATRMLTNTARKLARVVDEMVDYSEAIDTGEARSTRNSTVKIPEILNSVDALMRPTYAVRSINVRKEYPSSLPTLMGQAHKMSILLSYTLNVALQYTRSKDVRIRAYSGESGGVVVSFCDDSRSATQDEISDAFNSLTPSSEELPQAIARRVADIIGATITVLPASIDVRFPDVGVVQSVKDSRRGSRRPSFFSSPGNMRRSHSASPRKNAPKTIPEESPPQSSALQHIMAQAHASPAPSPIPSFPFPTQSPPTTSASTTLAHSQFASSSATIPPPSPLPQAPPPTLNSSAFFNFASQPFPFGSEERNVSLEAEIKELTAKLELAKSLYQLRKVSVKIRAQSSQFFHKVNLENPTIAQLKSVIVKRLKLNPTQSFEMVKDGDTLIEVDEDIVDGLCLDVFLS